MPNYIQVATGMQVDSATATSGDGRCKPGYRELLGDGDFTTFRPDFMDAASLGSRVEFRDSKSPSSIDQAWRDWAVLEIAEKQIMPEDWASQFARFAGKFAAQIGADGLAAIAGMTVDPKDIEIGDARRTSDRARRKKYIRDAWRTAPSQSAPKPALTGDAKADYEASRDRRRAEMSNAWRGN